MIEYRPQFSPPSTDSNRQLYGPSASFRYTDNGVSRSDRTSRTTGMRVWPAAANASNSSREITGGIQVAMRGSRHYKVQHRQSRYPASAVVMTQAHYHAPDGATASSPPTMVREQPTSQSTA